MIRQNLIGYLTKLNYRKTCCNNSNRCFSNIKSLFDAKKDPSSITFTGNPSSNIRVLRRTTQKDSSLLINQLYKRTPTKPNDQDFQNIPRQEQPQNLCHLGYPVKPVVSITACESYDLPQINKLLESRGYKDTSVIGKDEAIYFKYNDQVDIFILESGTVVVWDLAEDEVINKIIPLFHKAMITPYSIQSEDLDYIDIKCEDFKTGESKSETSFIDQEIICLKNSSEEQKLLDKLAFSYGISRSTRVAILEIALEAHTQLTKFTTENLSKGKELGINAKDVLTSSGRLMLLRGKLNLYSELIETPDLYWSEARLEKIYENISNVLDIPNRITILNRKLDYATEESKLLLDILNTRKGTILEWIIIYLILIEVFFEIYHFYERYLDSQKNKEIEIN
ncbi:unnamed protein product [[Candida] boidinii]|uniref:Unnamed protein product n=1 Tax=Candida boidinii TaxID=5477 RepID=A0A9W6SVK6_CANBO|nr:hypothetical protein B5S30_g2375 [[Candida] boidinii]OWB81667.1 hypothetical protein B5S33_g286 [[Candida] boidinii]GME67005.1 unnamed protein product [[Candida] boidinii]GMF01961.1 unnamed protein product [[Candida] boidinii]